MPGPVDSLFGGLQVAVQSNDKKRFETKVEADKD